MLVRFLVLAVALIVVGPAFAVQSSADAPTPPANDFGFEFWVGRHTAELRTALGDPKKVKQGSLVYRVLIKCGSEMYGPSDDGWAILRGEPPHLGNESEFPPPRRAVAKKITVAFRSDADDRITGYEVLRIKDKKCPK